MTVYTLRTLWCDGLDRACAQEIQHPERDAATARELRQLARRRGWTRRNGQDLCPDHSRQEHP